MNSKVFRKYGIVLACVLVVVTASIALVMAFEQSDTDSEATSTPTVVSSLKAINTSYLIQYSEKYGIDSKTSQISVDNITLFGRSFLVVALNDVANNKKLVLYTDYDSGDIYDHEPSREEVVPSIPSKISTELWSKVSNAHKEEKFDIIIYSDEVLTSEHISQIKELGVVIRNTNENLRFVAGTASKETVLQIIEMNWISSISFDATHTLSDKTPADNDTIAYMRMIAIIIAIAALSMLIYTKAKRRIK
jgi:hypothetical protein